MVKAPSALEAAHGFGRSGEGGKCGQKQEKRGAVVWEVGEQDGDQQTCKDECVSAHQRAAAKVEKGGEVRLHSARVLGVPISIPICIKDKRLARNPVNRAGVAVDGMEERGRRVIRR